MLDVSVAIATYNSEKTIENTLKSVAGWVREIIVVDGTSRDGTVPIVKKYTDKVYIETNPVIFHINKKKAIDRCIGAWILQLDSDEVVSQKLKEEIIQAIMNQESRIKNQEYNGYWIPRKNFFLGKFLEKGGQYPDYTLRLYRKGKGRLPCKSVHEQAQVKGETGFFRNPLHHYPYYDFSNYLTKSFNRYTDHFSMEMEKKQLKTGLTTFLEYFIFKPAFWFLKTYFRHKGFQDGFPGFVFSLFSAMHYPTAYIKYYEKQKKEK